jgi:hypothetical protein
VEGPRTDVIFQDGRTGDTVSDAAEEEVQPQKKPGFSTSTDDGCSTAHVGASPAGCAGLLLVLFFMFLMARARRRRR